jgi:hypothetical protein
MSDLAIDEVIVLHSAKIHPLLKAEITHWKHTDRRMKAVQKDMCLHLLESCNDPQALYVVIGKEVCWMSPQAVSKLAKTHHYWKEHFLTFMALAASDRTGYLMHVMGLLPDALLGKWHPDYAFTYKMEHAGIQQEAHEQILFCSTTNKMDRLDFGRYLLDSQDLTHSNAFCFRGEDWTKVRHFMSDEFKSCSAQKMGWEASQIAVDSTGRYNAICGTAWCAESNRRTQEFVERYLRGAI